MGAQVEGDPVVVPRSSTEIPLLHLTRWVTKWRDQGHMDRTPLGLKLVFY